MHLPPANPCARAPTWRPLLAAMLTYALVGFIARCHRPCTRSLTVARRLIGDALIVLAAAALPSHRIHCPFGMRFYYYYYYSLLPLFVPLLAAPSAPVPEHLTQSARTESMHGFITHIFAEWGAAWDARIVERRIFVK
ncbi:hypothetical protein DFH09DRAFT_1313568 [Mycena vulgaris]|nr:hypothetical protein DFH09DRAFT_1313568 [Mycena vulgaris]